MSFEEDFDGIIRRKAEETNVPFNEADWLKASAMLDAQRKPASLSWMYYAAAALLITAGIIWFYPGAPSSVHTVTKGASALPSMQSPELANQQIALENTGSTNTPSTIQPTLPLSNNAVLEPSDERVSTNALQKVTATTLHSAPQRPSTPLANQLPETAQESPSRSLGDKGSVGKDEGVLANSSTPNKEGNTSTDNSAPIVHDQKAPTTAPQPTMAMVSEKDSEKSSTNQVLPEATNPNENPILQTALAQESSASWMYLQNKWSNEERVEEVSSSLQPINRPDPEDYSKAKLKTHYARVGGGAVASNGWQGAKGTDGKGISPLLTGEYGIYFAKRFSLNAGVKFWQITNIQSPWYKVTSVNYNYFYTTNAIELTTTSMKMLSVPLGIAWHPHRRHQITAGIQMNAVLTAENTLTYSGPSETAGANRTEQKSGVYNGMNLYTWGAQAGYRYECMHRLSLTANAQMQLQAFFNGNIPSTSSKRPIFVSGGLAYTLFDK